MKKFLLMLTVALGFTAAANAQCDEFPTPATAKYKVATNSFWSNWFIQVGVDMAVQNPYGTNFLKTDWHDGRSYGVDFAIGKWFTPGLGIRIKANWENGQFAHAFRNTDHNTQTPAFHGKGYGAIYYDNLFNLSNMLCGYSDTRVWNFSLFPRFGVLRNFAENTYAPALGGGFESSWKLGKTVGLYIDAAYVITTDKFNGSTYPGHKGSNGIASVDLGLTFNLGNTGWSKAVNLEDYEALSAEACGKLAALRSQLKAEQDENARLRDLLAKQPKAPAAAAAAAETIVAATATSVFFDINSAKLNSKKDLINLESVASTIKATGAKVVVTGSADSKTGSSAYNQQLSEARAQAVADELVNLGVDRANIEVKGIGGVNDVAPFTLNRRAVVEVK